MIVPLVLLSSSLALTVYWVAGRLPLPAAPPNPVRHPTWLTPLERLLERNLHRAGLAQRLSGSDLLNAMLLGAGVGCLVSLPTRNHLLVAAAAVIGGMLPLQLVRWQIRRRTRARRAAALASLTQIARLYAVRRHPALAISDGLPRLASPMKDEFARALRDGQRGIPLPDALRAVAVRCDDDFYLHQFAGLVAVGLTTESDISKGLAYLLLRGRSGAKRRFGEAAWMLGALAQMSTAAAAGAVLTWLIMRPLGTILWLAAAAGACTYALLTSHPRFSPRQAMIRRLGMAPSAEGSESPWQALQARHRRTRAARSWPDLLLHLAIQTRAGADLPTAFASSLAVLREPLRSYVEELVADLRNDLPLHQALERFGASCDFPGARAFAQTLVDQLTLGMTPAEILAAQQETTPKTSNPSAI